MNWNKIMNAVVVIAVAATLAFGLTHVYIAMQPDLAEKEKVKAWAHQTYGQEAVKRVVLDNLGGASVVLSNGTWVEYPGDANVQLNTTAEVVG